MIFTFSSKFDKAARRIFSEGELRELMLFLAETPDSGDVIPGLKGCRKLRWGARGKGKRGGARVIYIRFVSRTEIRFLRAYLKSEQGDLSAQETNQLKNEIRDF